MLVFSARYEPVFRVPFSDGAKSEGVLEIGSPIGPCPSC